MEPPGMQRQLGSLDDEEADEDDVVVERCFSHGMSDWWPSPKVRLAKEEEDGLMKLEEPGLGL